MGCVLPLLYRTQRLTNLAQVIGGMDEDRQSTRNVVLAVPGVEALHQHEDALVTRFQIVLYGVPFCWSHFARGAPDFAPVHLADIFVQHVRFKNVEVKTHVFYLRGECRAVRRNWNGRFFGRNSRQRLEQGRSSIKVDATYLLEGFVEYLEKLAGEALKDSRIGRHKVAIDLCVLIISLRELPDAFLLRCHQFHQLELQIALFPQVLCFSLNHSDSKTFLRHEKVLFLPIQNCPS